MLQFAGLLRDPRILFTGILSTIIVIGLIASTGMFSVFNVESEESYTFATNPGVIDCVSTGSSMNFYGNNLRLDNSQADAGSNNNIAKLNYGGESFDMDEGGTVNVDGLEVSIKQIYERSTAGCPPLNSYDRDYITNILWDVKVDIPKEKITAEVSELAVEETGPGEKKVSANLTVNNDWKEIQVQKIQAEVFDKTVDLDSGTLQTGETKYSMVASESFYDRSKIIENSEYNGSIQVVFQNPKVPSSKVSGSPDTDGDLTESENFEDGIPLKDFRSEEERFTTEIKYCGSNMTYQDGECEVDEELHMRGDGDACPLFDSQMVVSKDFTSGQEVSIEDLQPEPDYFCTKHPVLETNPDGQTTGFKVEPYQKIVNRETVTVPEDRTWRFHWISSVNETETDVVCEQGSFNQESGKCEFTPGIVHKCTGDSVWDPSTGACVVHPEVETVCKEDNARYNSELGKCVIQKTGSCPAGTQEGPNGERCFSEASVTKKCPDGVNGTVEAGQCQAPANVLVQNNIFGDIRLLWLGFTEAVGSTVSSILPV